ncbi:YciI family protein [Pseudorhodoferax soli]|uniref:YCII-related domain-containing protein n=1 Tax=Pseudorhodoferax soli TaxID=545864 RepID=A0A368XHS3_9BURK|nr:YciI family protein [Pseudorhodoferax soli]RCW67503.1 hypothetical protein DES41_109226 [Pseudorhodoferax soli]
MSYLLLIHEPVGQRATRSQAEGRAAYDAMLRFGADLKERGLLVAAESLASEHAATRVQRRAGKTQLLDGPFAEAKEMVGGFFLLNCGTREEALAIAAQCPAAEWCTVEVRGLAPCWDDGRPA